MLGRLAPGAPRGFFASRSGGVSQQSRQAYEIVGGRGEGEGPSDPVDAAQHRPPHAADGLHPAECFLDPLTDPLARGIAGMAGGAPVDG